MVWRGSRLMGADIGAIVLSMSGKSSLCSCAKMEAISERTPRRFRHMSSRAEPNGGKRARRLARTNWTRDCDKGLRNLVVAGGVIGHVK